MNTAMEGILPKSPAAQQTIAEQVASKSPTNAPIPMQTSNSRPSVVNQQTPMQQNDEPPQSSQVPSQTVQQNNAMAIAAVAAAAAARKSEAAANGMMTQDLMTDHELLSYINASCFDTQNGFLM